MASNEYHFVSNWRVVGDIEDVYDVISDADVPRWWPAAFLASQQVQPGNENGVGRVVRLTTKGWMPYILHWDSAVTETDRPRGFSIRVWGDFNGSGVWRLEQDGMWTKARFDWRIRVDKPLVRYLSWLLKPLFASNHRWAMAKGEESLRLELARRQALSASQREAIASPPGPTKFPTRAAVAIGLACAGGLVLLSRRGRDDGEDRTPG